MVTVNLVVNMVPVVVSMVVAEVIRAVVDNLGTLVVSHMVDVACQIQVLVVVANLDSRAALVEDQGLEGVVLEEAGRLLARLFVMHAANLVTSLLTAQMLQPKW